jgi:hypothetical protein
MTQISTAGQPAPAAGPAPSPAPASARPAAPILTAEEWAAYRSDDWHAGAAIVGLMMTIFLLGMIGYVSICIWVAS